MDSVTLLSDFKSFLSANEAVLAYFTTESCSVCKVLKPKVVEMAAISFPLLKMKFIDCDLNPEISAAFQVFASPTILVFFDGRESIRKGRTFSVELLQSEIGRQYSIIFD